MRKIVGAALLAVTLVGPATGATSGSMGRSFSIGDSTVGADAGRSIAHSIVGVSFGNETNTIAFSCEAFAKGNIATTTTIRYCIVITTTGAVVRAVPSVGVKEALTVGGGRVRGEAQTACIGITASYLGGVKLKKDHCGSLDSL